MRRALIVGIDYYQHGGSLFGCVNDAHAVKSVLERHSDGSVNFDVMLMTGTAADRAIAKTDLRDAVEKLFNDGEPEIALFYFAGHGAIDSVGGYLCCSDSKKGTDGLSLSEIIAFANQSKAKNKMIILDSCHSGIAGAKPHDPKMIEICEGMTILTASSAEQYATEENGSGVFTALMVDGLNGSARDLVGAITPGSIYAHVDQALGAWEQRPIFKTNVSSFVALRHVDPPIARNEIQCLPEFFPNPGHIFALDPSFEPTRNPGEENLPPPDPANAKQFAILQRMHRVNLVVPVDSEHMYFAAMESKGCRLTVLGEHYRSLVVRKRI